MRSTKKLTRGRTIDKNSTMRELEEAFLLYYFEALARIRHRPVRHQPFKGTMVFAYARPNG